MLDTVLRSTTRWLTVVIRVLRNQVSASGRRSPARHRGSWSTGGSSFAAEIVLLEGRVLLSAGDPTAFAVTDHVPVVGQGQDGIPQTTSGPTGTTPAQIRHVYGFDNISFNGASANGSGMTIAIVDAYDDPNIANDLHKFDLAFKLPDPPSFIKENQFGSTGNLPDPNSNWITEIALDVEWAHAVAPGANILLVEANSNLNTDLYKAVDTARKTAGVVVVSMSFGGGEFSSEAATYDSYFTTPAGHAGVTFIASSGDNGAPVSYPSASPNVLSVGGTTLHKDSKGNWTYETGWAGSGGGLSAYEPQPAYQHGVVTQSATLRANPDVAYDSDPNTGFGVYDSYNNGTTRPWGQWGGTSDAAPQWAALIAIADQGRAIGNKGSLDGATQTLPMLYSMAARDFHDVTLGTSTGSPNYSAGKGYDLVTGRGTPHADLIVRDLGAGNTIGTPGETFESRNLTVYSPLPTAKGTASISSAARHDGSYGLLDKPANDWIYRTNAGASIQQGDTISVWLRFVTTADGRAYFGFGTSGTGTLALTASPGTNELLLQTVDFTTNTSTGGTFNQVAAVPQSWSANVWYRLEVQWGSNGAVVANLYNSSGAKLNTVSASAPAMNTTIASGGFGFRSIYYTKRHNVDWDTVAIQQGVNGPLTAPATGASSNVATGNPTLDYSGPELALPVPVSNNASATALAGNLPVVLTRQDSLNAGRGISAPIFVAVADGSTGSPPSVRGARGRLSKSLFDTLVIDSSMSG